jgi:hypothetical protein
MRERLSRWICRHLHRGITRPVNGEYICLRCQRRFPVLWQMPIAAPKVGGRFNFQASGGSPASPNAATGLPGAKAGILIDGVVRWIQPPSPASLNSEVAELERLLSLDRPKRVE